MIKCPICGTQANEGDIFCGNCGHRLQNTPAVQPHIPSQDSQPPPPPMPGPPSSAQSEGVVRPTGHYVVTPSTPPSNQPPSNQPSPVIQPSTGQAPPPPPHRGQAISSPPSSQPTKKNRKGCVIAIIGIGLLFLCGLVVVGGIFLLPELIPSLEPTPPVVLTPYDDGSTPSDAEAPLDVVNNSVHTICYLYISPSTSDDWGEDWLWDIGTIEPGSTSTFYLPVGETFDMRTEDCDGELLDEQYNVTVPSEGLTYTLTP